MAVGLDTRVMLMYFRVLNPPSNPSRPTSSNWLKTFNRRLLSSSIFHISLQMIRLVRYLMWDICFFRFGKCTILAFGASS
jgi:hypothetical protein